MKKLICLLLAVVFLCGCTEQPQVAPEPVYECSYSDSSVIIETRELIRIDSANGEDHCFLRIRLTNLKEESIVLSSLMCFKISAEGNVCARDRIGEASGIASESIIDYVSADGLVQPNESLECYIYFSAPKNTSAFEIEIATDYSNGEWISFEYKETQ